MPIQWFPGHMAKARRELEEKLKLVDFVIELVDARAPFSSQNPMLENVLQNKPKLVLLMKTDLADRDATKEWLTYFEKQNVLTMAVNVNNKSDIKGVVQLAKRLGDQKMAKLKRKGMLPRAARAMIVGVPNVGKSTLINRVANKKTAKTGDRPGVTQHQLWIKVGKGFELLDTPGLLWPKFEDEEVGYRLAALGTIKDQLLPLDDIAAFIITYMQTHYPKQLQERLSIGADEDDMLQIMEGIGRRRGCLQSGGGIDLQKVATLIVNDFRSGRLGPVTMEYK